MRAVIATSAAYNRWCSYATDSDNIVFHRQELKAAEDHENGTNQILPRSPLYAEKEYDRTYVSA